MTKPHLLLALLFFAAPAFAAPPKTETRLTLKVVSVQDGDTITGLDESKTQYKIRLDAIDAPELGQPFGQALKKALSEKVFGKNVTVIPKTKDKYGRTVGHILINSKDLNLEMLKVGMAWHYKHYDHNARLARAEEEAGAASSTPPWRAKRATLETGLLTVVRLAAAGGPTCRMSPRNASRTGRRASRTTSAAWRCEVRPGACRGGPRRRSPT